METKKRTTKRQELHIFFGNKLIIESNITDAEVEAVIQKLKATLKDLKRTPTK